MSLPLAYGGTSSELEYKKRSQLVQGSSGGAVRVTRNVGSCEKSRFLVRLWICFSFRNFFAGLTFKCRFLIYLLSSSISMHLFKSFNIVHTSKFLFRILSLSCLYKIKIPNFQQFLANFYWHNHLELKK